jgi:hypothetical protein
MDDNFTFTGGKYNGKTYAWVMETNPQYISWCRENAPNMLKERKPPEPKKEITELKFRDTTIPSMVPNMNFDNEGPDKYSHEYLKNNTKD